MIHEPNTTRWKLGDIVIHDAKNPQMLMRVTGANKAGLYITRYVDQSVSTERYENRLAVLHDPSRFGIHISCLSNISQQTAKAVLSNCTSSIMLRSNSNKSAVT